EGSADAGEDRWGPLRGAGGAPRAALAAARRECAAAGGGEDRRSRHCEGDDESEHRDAGCDVAEERGIVTDEVAAVRRRAALAACSAAFWTLAAVATADTLVVPDDFASIQAA